MSSARSTNGDRSSLARAVVESERIALFPHNGFIMRTFLILLIAAACFAGCSSSDASNETANASHPAVPLRDSGSTREQAENPGIAAIRAAYNRINAAPLDTVSYTFQCDEKATVIVYKSEGEVVKVRVDWGWVGDAATVTEYYYQNRQLVFRYVRSVGGAAAGPAAVSEARTYVKDNKVIRYLQGGREVRCEECRFDASAKEYAVLQANTDDEMRVALCR